MAETEEAPGPNVALISFYGFKGGAGRTLAAVHMAYLYSRMGKRVLLVDADLEAPGLSFWNPYKPGQSDNGLVQLLLELDDVPESEITGSFLDRYVCSIPDFFDREREEDPRSFEACSDVHLLPAGIGPTVEALDVYVEQLPHVHVSIASTADKLRRVFERSGYDVILLDSRPGLHRIAGALFNSVADFYIVLFGASGQALRGLVTAIEMFAPEQLDCVVFAMSPVAWQEADRVVDAQNAIRQTTSAMGSDRSFNITTISWHPTLAHDERIISVADPTSATARDYQALFLELETTRGYGISQYTESIDALLDIYKGAVSSRDSRESHQHLIDLLDDEVTNAFPEARGAYTKALQEFVARIEPELWACWKGRDQFVRLVVWEMVRRLHKLAELDEYAAEALWAIIIRRNHAGSENMGRYQSLYEVCEGSEDGLPRILEVLQRNYRLKFGRGVDGVSEPVPSQIPNPEVTLEDFVAAIGALA